ncbi:MAG TPA: AsmA family protein [Nitrospiraceae bacterium]|jgi:AsmA protein|nr:AsmA family protein [Nitrospiraceae bacterium]
MMKVLAVLGVVVLALVLLVLLLPFIIDLNKYQDQYRPIIEDALNRKISLKDIRLTIFPRIGARVAGFSVLDDPAFGANPFASLTSLDVGVKLMPLLSGRIEIEAITLRDPVITVIKNRDGALNVSTIGKKGPAEPKAVTRVPTHPPEGPLRILALLAVDRVSLTGGTITYRDLSVASPVEYRLQDLTVKLASVGLGQTPKLRLETLVQPLNLPIAIDGAFGPLKETADIESATVDLALGKTQLAIKGSSVGGSTQLSISSQVINTADLPLALPLKKPVEIKNLQISAELKGQEARVNNLSFDIFNGQTKAQVGLTLGADAPPFNGKVVMQGLQLGPALEAVGTDQVSISGTAAMEMAILGRGFTMPDLTKALEGIGHLDIKDGKLEGVNLLQEVAALLKVAGISTDNVKATVFSTIEGDVAIKQGVVAVQRLLLDSHDFQATANGTVGFDQTLHLKASLNLSEALSQKIATGSPVAKLAMSNGRVTVPLVITGTVQTPFYGLDTKAIGAKVQEQVKEKAKEVVEEMLKSKSPEEAVQKGQEMLKQLFGR